MNEAQTLDYVKAAAAALGLRLDAGRARAVAQHLERTAAMAAAAGGCRTGARARAGRDLQSRAVSRCGRQRRPGVNSAAAICAASPPARPAPQKCWSGDRSRRGDRRPGQRLHRQDPGARARGSGGGGRPTRARRSAAAAGGIALCGEEPVRHRRHHHSGGLADQPRPAAGAGGCGPGAAHEGGRGRAAGRAQHGRICLRLHHRKQPLRPDAEPARPDPDGRRLLGWLGRRRRGGAGAADAGLRHQRLDPGAGVAVRRVGAQAHVRAALAARQLSLRSQHRPPRPAGRQRRRPGAVVRRAARPGPARSGLPCAARPAGRRRPGPRSPAPAHRRAGRLFP